MAASWTRWRKTQKPELGIATALIFAASCRGEVANEPSKDAPAANANEEIAVKDAALVARPGTPTVTTSATTEATATLASALTTQDRDIQTAPPSTDLAVALAEVIPCAQAYAHQPLWIKRPKTSFPSDVMATDMDGDGWPDIVLSSGADEIPEALTVIYNPQGPRLREPWQSSAGHYVRLALGDLDHNGFVDIVASIAPPRDTAPREAAHIYMNHAGELPREPTYRVAGYASLALSLADFTGDGWLDLSLGQFGTTLTNGKSSLYVYVNREGTFDFSNPSWQSGVTGDAGVHLAADLDQDGAMDLLVAGLASAWGFRFSGTTAENAVQLATSVQALPSYKALRWSMASFVTVGRAHSASTALDVYLSFNSDPFTAAPSPFVRFDAAGIPYGWTSEQTGIGGGVALADLNGDADPDLIGAQWQAEKPGGPYHAGPLLAFCGANGAPQPQGSPIGVDSFIGQGVALADFDRADLREAAFSRLLEHTPTVITLPHQHVHAVLDVTFDGVGIHSTVAYTAGSNWISIPRQPVSQGTLNVRYLTSQSLDVIIADRQPGREESLPIVLHAGLSTPAIGL